MMMTKAHVSAKPVLPRISVLIDWGVELFIDPQASLRQAIVLVDLKTRPSA
jgi:hypothetical protein